MKITVFFKDSAIQPVEIDELLSVKIGNSLFEEQKLVNIPLSEEKAIFVFNGKNKILTVRGSSVSHLLLEKD